MHDSSFDLPALSSASVIARQTQLPPDSRTCRVGMTQLAF